MTRVRRLLALVLLAALGGCATTSEAPPPRQSQAPRARCLANPHETSMRPLLFLFCVESP